jgi:hypothetical protein
MNIKERELKTRIVWVIEYLSGKRYNKNFYESFQLAEQFAPTPSVIWRKEIIEL